MSDIILASTGLPELFVPQQRTAGIHLSEIINDICHRLGYFVESESGMDWSLIRLGSTFEWALIQRYYRQFPGEYLIPGECEHDGTLGHPDLLRVIKSNRCVKEIKFTWRSSGPECGINSTPPADHPIRGRKFWKDWTQLKGYCHMMSESVHSDYRTGELEICHPKGDYKEFKTVHSVWRQEFTEYELRDNWEMLQRHADDHACRGCYRFESNRDGHAEWCTVNEWR